MKLPTVPRPRVWHPYAVWLSAAAVGATTVPHAAAIAAGVYVFGLMIGLPTLHTPVPVTTRTEELSR